MFKLLKEPLVHFIALGAALFFLHSLSREESEEAGRDNRIVVTSGRIEQLAGIFAKTWQRPPTSDELKGLIDDFVLEEIYYRQAKAMELDDDDTLIRRRLRQKFEFLTEDLVDLTTPGDDELQRYLEDYSDDFRRDPTYTFQQVYFNPERHEPDPLAFAREQCNLLRSGESVEGDATLLPAALEGATSRMVDNTFGLGFAQSLDELTLGEWSDPIRSGLGLHLIRLDARVPGRLPPLEEVRPAVQREWANDRRNEMRDEINRRLLDDYEVLIEWPQREPETGDGK